MKTRFRIVGVAASTLLIAGCGGSADADGNKANNTAAVVQPASEPDNLAAANMAGAVGANQGAPAGASAGADLPPADWTGDYESASGDVSISRASGEDRYRVSVDVGTPGCAGQAEGTGVVQGSRMTVTSRLEDEDASCTITIRRAGPRLDVEEGPGCLPFHGASCGFDMQARLKAQGRSAGGR